MRAGLPWIRQFAAAAPPRFADSPRANVQARGSGITHLTERVYDARVSRPIVLPDPPLTDGRVTLRPWSTEDVPAIVAMCREPDVIRFTSVPVPYDADDARLWLDLHPSRLAAGDGAAFAITEDGARPVGSIGVRVLHDQGIAETGYHVVAESRGSGLATAALRLIARWTFAELPVARLQLTTHLDNPASQRVAEKAGFTREGVLRAWADQRGERVDLVMWSLLPGDPIPS
jgi:RimJ/RimL family protein N-acetyltransferase